MAALIRALLLGEARTRSGWGILGFLSKTGLVDFLVTGLELLRSFLSLLTLLLGWASLMAARCRWILLNLLRSFLLLRRSIYCRTMLLLNVELRFCTRRLKWNCLGLGLPWWLFSRMVIEMSINIGDQRKIFINLPLYGSPVCGRQFLDARKSTPSALREPGEIMVGR